MDILFYIGNKYPRKEKISFVQNEGMSGTEKATFLLAKEWSKYARVIVLSDICAEYENNNCISTSDFQKYTSCDILVLVPWVPYDEITYIHVRKAYLVYMHCQIVENCLQPLYNQSIPVFTNHLSHWGHRVANKHFQIGQRQSILPYCIYNQLPCKYTIYDRTPDFFFPACYERGGQFAEFVLQHFPDKTMYVCQYTNKITTCHPQTRYIGSLNSENVGTYFRKTRYFIYGLVCEHFVHKDTFAFVVAEAILNGCIVFTFPVAALAELYDECVEWIPCDRERLDREVNSHGVLEKSNWLFDYVQDVVNRVQYLDNHPTELEQLRQRYFRNFVERARKYNENDYKDLLDNLSTVSKSGRYDFRNRNRSESNHQSSRERKDQ
jgi:hypothetical protein